MTILLNLRRTMSERLFFFNINLIFQNNISNIKS